MATYKIKFVSGPLVGSWKTGQSWQEANKLVNILAEVCQTDRNALYSSAIAWDDHNGNWGAYKFAGMIGEHYPAVLWIVREYED